MKNNPPSAEEGSFQVLGGSSVILILDRIYRIDWIFLFFPFPEEREKGESAGAEKLCCLRKFAVFAFDLYARRAEVN